MVSSYYATQSPETDRAGAGSTILSITSDFTQGPFVTTNNWSDLAIIGDGFFNVEGPNGTTLYTRDGSFHLNSDGYLVNMNGYSVLDTSGNEIRVLSNPASPSHKELRIDENGYIWGYPVAGGDIEQLPSGAAQQLAISTFPNQDGLIRQGNNLYMPGPEAGTAVRGAPNSGPRGRIEDLTLEGSNVNLASEMVNMIIYQADYNANSKSILTASAMLDTVVNLIR
jgi:flagellar hook protein FlgE